MRSLLVETPCRLLRFMLFAFLKLQRTPENGNVAYEEIKRALPNPHVMETEEKPQKSLNEKQQVSCFESYDNDAYLFSLVTENVT